MQTIHILLTRFMYSTFFNTQNLIFCFRTFKFMTSFNEIEIATITKK